MEDLVERALALATKAHEGQVRKNSGIPYIEHPKDVLRTFEDLVVPYLESGASWRNRNSRLWLVGNWGG
jgi:(p)ppGpp synthase/HD superfamily hydrolase